MGRNGMRYGGRGEQGEEDKDTTLRSVSRL